MIYMKKTAPSTKAHEIYDAAYQAIIFVGSRTAANRKWMALPPARRARCEVRVSK